MEKQEQASAGPWLLPLLESDIGELLRVTQHAPDGLARGRYRGRQGGVIILKEGQDFHQQQLDFLAQLGERPPGAAVVKGFELPQQVIDLILQRELGEHADGVSISQPLLEGGQVQRGGCPGGGGRARRSCRRCRRGYRFRGRGFFGGGGLFWKRPARPRGGRPRAPPGTGRGGRRRRGRSRGTGGAWPGG